MYKISIKNANNNFKFDELCNGCLYRGIGINIGIGIIKYSPNNYYITIKIRDLYNALQEKQKSKKNLPASICITSLILKSEKKS